MKKLLKISLLVFAICSLAACQEDAPEPEEITSQKHEPSVDIEEMEVGNN